MNKEQVMALPGRDNPVLCADGKMGILILYPSQKEVRCGVQVHGEDAHRWIDASDLTSSEGGALREAGAPKMPTSISQQHDMAQTLLAVDWVQRGGLLMDVSDDDPEQPGGCGGESMFGQKGFYQGP